MEIISENMSTENNIAENIMNQGESQSSDVLSQNLPVVPQETEGAYSQIPPLPPTNKFVPGKFQYIESTHEREMLANAFQAISLTESWDFVKKDIESFMWSNDPTIWVISNKMSDLGYNGHSGFSFGHTMRVMQHIAKYGEESYMKLVLEKK